MDTEPFSPRAIRRFLLAATLSFAFVFGAIWIWVLAAPMAYLNWDYPVWLAKERFVQDGRCGQLAILGDSAPNADLLPQRLGAGVVNLALSGATPIEVYYQSKRILASPSRPRAILLSLSPHRFMMQDTYWDKSANFGSFTYGEIDEARALARRLHENGPFGPESPGDLDARLKALLYSIRFPSLYAGALINARLAGRRADNEDVYQMTVASRGQMYYGRDPGTQQLDQGTDFDSFTPLKMLDAYFGRTIELYRAANIPVYFLTMPHNEVSVPHYPAGLKENFTAYLDRYAAAEPNFHILGDLLPVYPSADFSDSAHLNEKGAARWSDTVAKILNDAQVPGGPFGPN